MTIPDYLLKYMFDLVSLFVVALRPSELKLLELTRFSGFGECCELLISCSCNVVLLSFFTDRPLSLEIIVIIDDASKVNLRWTDAWNQFYTMTSTRNRNEV